MCSRYFVELSPELRPIIEAARRSPLAAKMLNSLGKPVAKDGEIWPTDISAVICSNSRGMRAAFPMIWGFSMSDFENTKRSAPLINTRIETAASKPTWKESYTRRRCIIPASYYFEWQRIKTSDGRSKPGDRYIVQPEGSPIAFMAGVYRMEGEFPHFSILTREPEPGFIHDRMPVLLKREYVAEWINPAASPERIREIAGSAITAVVAEKD